METIEATAEKPVADRIVRAYVVLGADPELFLAKRGRTVGSEKVIPEEGLKTERDDKVIRDGVQVEFNPTAQSCRQFLAQHMASCFKTLHKSLENTGLKISYDATVEVTKAEMRSLSPGSRKFGCKPSKNAYHEGEYLNEVDGETFMQRSAGGHIHLGFYEGTEHNSKTMKNLMKKHPATLVKLLDYVLGNTCVLLDRDPGTKERRKMYGKAGEYRTPKHGLEYRVLSNFWIKDYKLMSFVFGLARQAMSIAYSSVEGAHGASKTSPDFMAEIFAAVPEKDIIKAINQNDAVLAMRNFKKIRPILERITQTGDSFALHKDNIPRFLYLVEQGIDAYIAKDTTKHWLTLSTAHGNGWESFSGPGGTLARDMMSKPQKVLEAVKGVARAIAV